MAKQKAIKPLRVVFAAKQDDLELLDRLSEDYGNVDRQSVIRIALKELADARFTRKRA